MRGPDQSGAFVSQLTLRRILVPVNGGDMDEEMVRLAAFTAKSAGAQLIIVYVIVVKRTLPLDVELEDEVQKGEKILDLAERVAERYEVERTSELLQARATGPAIVDEAV